MIQTNLLPKGVKYACLTKERVHYWWEKLKNFDKLFNDDTYYDEINFFNKMFHENTHILEVEDNGIIVLDNVVEGLKAQAHVSFWDFKLSARTELLRNCLIWAILEFKLYRIEISIPEFSRALRRFAEKRLHFKYEGRLRETLWYKGQLVDMIVLSILRREVLEWHQQD